VIEPAQELAQAVAVADALWRTRARRVAVGPENRRASGRLSSDRLAVLYAMPSPALDPRLVA
jgi:hypothetical protein